MSDTVRISKSLSYLLRHGAAREGLEMDPGGYVAMDSLLRHRSFRGVSAEQLLHIVASCPKQRFGQKQVGSQTFLRANQGHTLKTVAAEQLLRPILPTDAGQYPVVIHGTFRHCLENIMATGLSRMKRQHIHFATRLPGEEERGISGLRGHTNVFIFVDFAKALKDGIKFYVSENGVVLTAGVDEAGTLPPHYFARIADLSPDGTLRDLV